MSDSTTKPLPSGKPLSLRRETVRMLKVRTNLATGLYEPTQPTCQSPNANGSVLGNTGTNGGGNTVGTGTVVNGGTVRIATH